MSERSNRNYTEVTTCALRAACKQVEENGHELSDDVISILSSLFKRKLLEAVQILDEGTVVKIDVERCNYSYYLVSHKSDMAKVYVNTDFCECSRFQKSLVLDSGSLCPHLIAARLAESMNLVTKKTVSNLMFT